MNQLNKEYIHLLLHSGVNYFQNENPNNFFENYGSNRKIDSIKSSKKNLSEVNKIEDLVNILDSLNNPLKKTAKKTVVFDGNQDSNLMIIGEAPGKDEDDQGKPFVGKAGQLLNKMLDAINLRREEVYITNVVPWRPPNNRTPTEDEILELLPFLQRQIDIIKPKFIYLLGLTAVKAILSTPLSLSKLRGKWQTYKSMNLTDPINVLVSYHPAFLLRSPQYKKEAWLDLQMLQKKINNES
ncbi:MAG: hypothetical protein CFH15_01352 [Alphaproteobacteria bacterium MarineAlpha5_Bin5]|nr:MAG: hypothetical protein CFH15_01352 [Alphaproteobacteria bacterium MarineAlpha5_Bin5]PPR51916.1 MAG: hypothetical protein CFH14_00598 [Alphaproteobacteria bacterium MarineAlpha5_Bin4]|tara:strand:- start:3135 stop:3854 length:720 start_codon:yes stop_codon:yes gene_type:complete